MDSFLFAAIVIGSNLKPDRCPPHDRSYQALGDLRMMIPVLDVSEARRMPWKVIVVD